MNLICSNQTKEWKFQLNVTANYRKNCFEYQKSRILKNFTFGKRKEHYKNKQVYLKEKLKLAREILKNV